MHLALEKSSRTNPALLLGCLGRNWSLKKLTGLYFHYNFLQIFSQVHPGDIYYPNWPIHESDTISKFRWKLQLALLIKNYDKLSYNMIFYIIYIL